MKSKKFCQTAVLSALLFFASTGFANAEIMANATISYMIIPAENTNTAVVAFNINNPDNTFSTYCETGFNRVKFAKSDKQILAFLMMAYSLKKNVSFYYNPNGTTLSQGITGHGVGTCELMSIWIEP